MGQSDGGCDFLIIGGGIAGASLGYWLAPHGRTVLLEREDQPGYHATGRSAALFLASYGTPQVRALTRASQAFLQQPPAGFGGHPLLSPRGALMVAQPGEEALLAEQWAVLRSVSPIGQWLDAAAACAVLPVLRPQSVLGALLEPDAFDIDVHALLQGFLRGLRQRGGQLVCSAEVRHIERVDGQWQVHAGQMTYRAPVLVNAAGAWCDQVAALAGVPGIGLMPRRRSAFLFEAPATTGWPQWPMAIGLDHGWYIKPDAGLLLGSPANEDPMPPQDVQPEALDIATGVHRIEQMTTLVIRRPLRPWAGLRSFVPDGDLVGGFDPLAPGFFWLAAQGGYGIQTSAAMGEACAALVRGLPLPQRIADFGLTPAMLGPQRLLRRHAA
ncbi:MAG TPA: FAD-dependent oxidoreductase [Rubrivivax sp.]|nr:FAD-dependent oxidoreductase [Rubrivivax sp.]